ncbi:MAG: glycosyltransferase family 4 protein [Candidatus Pacearchaeota archaeon]|jgi:glycosyltransferase involved in cell wall biosynthesis
MSNPHLKIIEICPFSKGICGVWARVISESNEFTRLGNQVTVISSDIIKGTNEKAISQEDIDNICIKRFKSKGLSISKNVNSFNFESELQNLIHKNQVDIVITHLLHPHSFNALRICLKNKIPCYLVTHAPFNVKRKFPLNFATSFYNKFKVKPLLNKFTKVIAITKWEYPYLKRLGLKENKIVYIPNGLPEEFFSEKINHSVKGKDVLFLGRIAPVKNLETFVYTAKLLPHLHFAIVGSFEKEYLDKLDKIIKKNNLKNIRILPPVYNLKQKIKLIDSYKLFVLPSNREAMPQVLLEAMARQKIVISSNTDGGREIIKNQNNGLLFEIGDSGQLADLIKSSLSEKNIQKQAREDSKKYSWRKLIKVYLSLFKNDINNNNCL